MSASHVQVETGRRPGALQLHSQRAGAAPAPAVARLMALRDAAVREAETAAALQAASAQLAAGLEQLPQLVAAQLQQISASAVELGLTIAEAVAGGALDLGRFDPQPLVEKCLAELLEAGGGPGLRIQVAAADAERLGAALAREIEAGAELVADPQLPRGAVRVTTASGAAAHYDLRQVAERITARIREELREA